MASDGKRLQRALETLGIPQAEAARRSDVRQNWINDIAKGNRAIGREDLRKLAGIGVSADYVLGLAPTLIAPGETRTRADLESDLARAIERELTRLHPPTILGSGERFSWRVSGSAALDAAIAGCAAEAEKRLEASREVKSFHAEIGAILDFVRPALRRLEKRSLRDVPPDLVALTKAAAKLVNRFERRARALVPRDGAPVVLWHESSSSARPTRPSTIPN